jgi:hypothetical protein
MAMHWRWRRTGLSNNAIAVIECDGPIDAERVRGSVKRLLGECPWPAARLRRSLPWGRLEWVEPRRGLSAPTVRRRVCRSPDELHLEIESELNAGIDPRREPPVRVLLAECDGGEPRTSALVLTWFHPFMDPHGAQNLLLHLSRLDRESAPGEPVAPRFTRSADPRPLQERGRIARRSLAYMQTLAPIPPVSPGTGLVSPGRLRFRRDRHDDGGGGRSRRSREICWRLAVVGRAMAELWQRRGLPDAPFLVPIAIDLRRKGELGPIFGNCLAFHFARFDLSETGDAARLAGALRRQLVEALRDGQIEANAVAMDFLQHRPLAMMMRSVPWAAGGETFSFNCADVADFPATLGSIFGRRVVNAYHVPAVLPRPGIGVFFNRCGTATNVVTAWVEGAADEDDARRIMDDVRDAMGWARSA